MVDHHPDMELIIALAGGEMPPEEAARIESQLDPEARAELAAQRAALAALGELRRPAMSPEEGRRLRSAVRRELGLDPGHVHPARSPRRPRQWFARALPALATAASLVAVIAIAVNLTGGRMSEDEPAATTAAAAAPEAAPTTAAPTTTASALAAPDVEATTTAAMEEEAMLEEAQAEAAPAAEAAAALEEAEAAMDEPEALAEEAAADYAPTTTTEVLTRVTDTTEPFSAEREPDLAFAFSTDRRDEALLFTDAVIAEGAEPAVPVARLADRAVARGLVCWEYVATAAGQDDSVSFFGYGLVDGEAGEAYRIEPGPSGSQEGDAEEAALILLFVYPECRPVDFSTG
ncbi:MAG: hypothetical protein OXS29_00035 [bacterium]|nr:hypothetical protein [bacterium]MDE0288070.1 hypothetical protein [bacterium]MDE0438517.1 hypothetical protein [bacterium]